MIFFIEMWQMRFSTSPENNKNISGRVWETGLWRCFSGLFRSEWTLIFIFNDSAYIVLILQCQIVQHNCRIICKRAKSNVVPVFYNGALCYVRAFTVAIFHRCSTWIRSQKNIIRPRLNNTTFYLPILLVTKRHNGRINEP